MVYRPRGREKEEMRNLEASLYTKAWLCHCVMMLSRIVYPLLGIAYWQSGFKDRDKNLKLDQEFAAQIEKPLTTVIIAIIPIGVLIDVICWRYRSLAKWIIYYEAISHML